MWEPIVQQRTPHGVCRVFLKSARPQLKLPRPIRMRQKEAWQFVLRSPVLLGLRYVHWNLSFNETTNTHFHWIHFGSLQDPGATGPTLGISWRDEAFLSRAYRDPTTFLHPCITRSPAFMRAMMFVVSLFIIQVPVSGWLGTFRTRLESKKVSALAGKEAKALNHSYVGTEHILLGLARRRGNRRTAARVFKSLGSGSRTYVKRNFKRIKSKLRTT